jgi:Ca-activated chloride channel family protein
MIKKQFILPALLIIALYGCTEETKEQGIVPGEKISNETDTAGKSEPSTDSNTEEVSKPKKEMVVEPLPKTLNDLAAMPPGYTGHLSVIDDQDKKKIDELTQNLPDISSNPTNEELDNYYSALLSVYQQDYEGPEDLIEQFQSGKSDMMTDAV